MGRNFPWDNFPGIHFLGDNFPRDIFLGVNFPGGIFRGEIFPGGIFPRAVKNYPTFIEMLQISRENNSRLGYCFYMNINI